MKTVVIVMTVMFASFVAKAESSKTVAQLKSVDADIASVQLTEGGVLKVQTNNKLVLSEQLSASNAGRLVYAAKTLGAAELTTDHRDLVCMIVTIPQDLSVLGADGQLKLVLSSNSCAMHSYTHPKDPSYLTIAEELKAELITLAEELANN